MPCTTRSGGVHDCRTALSVEGVTPQHWRVTFDHRPIKVNRVVPDDEADRIARRIASFDKQAIAETKRLVDVASLPPDAEIAPEWEAFMAALARPAAQTRIKALMDRGFHKPGDVETRLGYHVGQLGR